MRLYLVRHGRPEIAPGICYGSTDVRVPQQEHQRVADALAPRLPPGVGLWTSPASRCRDLAQCLAGALGAPAPAVDARLQEMDFGEWEMRAWDDIARAEIDAWAGALPHYRPGQGESVLQVARRVAAFHASLQNAGHAQAIVVCHAGTIRLLARLHAGVGIEEAALAAAATPHRIGYGEVLMLG